MTITPESGALAHTCNAKTQGEARRHKVTLKKKKKKRKSVSALIKILFLCEGKKKKKNQTNRKFVPDQPGIYSKTVSCLQTQANSIWARSMAQC